MSILRNPLQKKFKKKLLQTKLQQKTANPLLNLKRTEIENKKSLGEKCKRIATWVETLGSRMWAHQRRSLHSHTPRVKELPAGWTKQTNNEITTTRIENNIKITSSKLCPLMSFPYY